MPTTIQITTDNYDGQTAVITYYPDTGGTINLGSQVLPYDYNTEYYYGTYSLYFPEFDITCTLIIPNQTPTPSATITPTPTITPTMTPTPTPPPTKQYYVYELCNSKPPQYVVQTQQALIGNVIRTPIGRCWEFLYVTSNPTFPPGTNIINWDGDYLSPALGVNFNNCDDCLSYNELCVCYTVTYSGPPPPQLQTVQVTYFSYVNCSGVIVNDSVGNGEIAPTSVDICAQIASITITGGDELATSDISSVNCCKPCKTYSVIGPRTISFTNCEGISQTVIIPSGDSLEICSRNTIGGATEVGPC